MNFLKELQSVGANKLKPVLLEDCKDRSTANLKELTSDDLKEESKVFEQFFKSGCGSWFDLIKDQTFSSTFCSLFPSEARVILRHWQDLRNLRTQMTLADASAEQLSLATESLLQSAVLRLEPLRVRLQVAIDTEIAKSSVGMAFVKLSTRSPKDSKKALRAAQVAYNERMALHASVSGEPMCDNDRWRVLCETTTQSGAVRDAAAALILLLDSDRVFEDLEYALRGPPGIDSDAAGCASDAEAVALLQWNTDLVARAWDPRLKPESELRGICWGGKLTCLCQYFHPLVFPELIANKARIEDDIWASFNNPKTALAVAALGGNCIVDFAWLGPGEVVIIELNPFDGLVLGTFPASTGLFLWDDESDRAVMKGDSAFEFRLRETHLAPHELKAQCNKDWRDIIYGTSVWGV
jgi:hypothetical protein